MEKIVCNHITPLYYLFPAPKASAALGQNGGTGSGSDLSVPREDPGNITPFSD
jgi:hypothetical protein